MTEKEKKLLITDLSSRVLYGVIISPADSSNAILIGCITDGVLLQDVQTGRKYEKPWELEYIKPYLRPMEDMTEKEREAYQDIIIAHTIRCESWYEVDWLNAHYLDYRGLICKGLALKAPEGMYIKN